ncbi:hypothetical protein DSECCO2_244190 [anaerobic digester metagenome]
MAVRNVQDCGAANVAHDTQLAVVRNLRKFTKTVIFYDQLLGVHYNYSFCQLT